MSSAAALPTGTAPTSLFVNPPFRHAHVGSFLRPAAVHEARAQFASGSIDATALRQIEDREIAAHVQTLLQHNIQEITDGEFRREYFHLDFLKHISGITISKNTLEQKEGRVPPTLSVTGKLRHTGNIEVENFKYLRSLVPEDAVKRIKITIPSPTMCHFRGGRAAISSEAYPDLEEFFSDLAAVYRTEIDALYAAGCRYVQLDDTNLAYLTDQTMRSQAQSRGEDLDRLPHDYARLINASLASKPADMVAAIHLCKGNFRSQFFAQGSEEGYNPIAEVLFQKLNVNAFFLEWEDERSGKDFSALKHLPKNKIVVLGLVSSKFAEMEDKAKLVQKINEAAKSVVGEDGLKQLAISPQCGFSSTVHGNEITPETQFAKLGLCRDVALDVWGDAV
ncbi:Methionine synthase, vitamin-B12 independent [Kalmanozyma brasiliensis GHG001]|uniref:Putative Methionine synthase, vitamin-b12 independent n=1 Tax=Kalmanozyma brasiliensis (strain GHG001) TaxID=1365824 RepID=V5EF30_KALBG|nr:Methionine synthase, vitamin-B12 independent [Kalmanozyma brasiliensis GHG001]EST09076.1 Methionine synthase, vitamin-B12 independent [Kalmanozyma brasiliensis GHG001]